MTWTYQNLPLYSDYQYTYVTSIGGQSRNFYFYVNIRTNIYHFDITNQDGTAVLLGMPLVPLTAIADNYQLQEFGITGYFYMIPIKPNIVFENIDPSEINKYYVLSYVSEDTSS